MMKRLVTISCLVLSITGCTSNQEFLLKPVDDDQYFNESPQRIFEQLKSNPDLEIPSDKELGEPTQYNGELTYVYTDQDKVVLDIITNLDDEVKEIKASTIRSDGSSNDNFKKSDEEFMNNYSFIGSFMSTLLKESVLGEDGMMMLSDAATDNYNYNSSQIAQPANRSWQITGTATKSGITFTMIGFHGAINDKVSEMFTLSITPENAELN